MAGINPAAESPGFKKAVLTPRPNFRLKSVEASLNSPAGIYTVGWHMETDKTIRLRVQVPFDCEARLILPFSNGREELLRAGSYEFHYKAIKPLGEPPEIDGPFNRLKECIPVRPLLDKYFAGWQNIPRFHGQGLFGTALRNSLPAPEYRQYRFVKKGCGKTLLINGLSLRRICKLSV